MFRKLLFVAICIYWLNGCSTSQAPGSTTPPPPTPPAATITFSQNPSSQAVVAPESASFTAALRLATVRQSRTNG